jgi:hypothetical protein
LDASFATQQKIPLHESLNNLGYRLYTKKGMGMILPYIPNHQSKFSPRVESLENTFVGASRMVEAFRWIDSTNARYYSSETNEIVGRYCIKNKLPNIEVAFFPFVPLINRLPSLWVEGDHTVDLGNQGLAKLADQCLADTPVWGGRLEGSTKKLSEEEFLGYKYVSGQDSCRTISVSVKRSNQIIFEKLTSSPISPQTFVRNAVLIAKNWAEESNKLLETPCRVTSGQSFAGSVKTRKRMVFSFGGFLEVQRSGTQKLKEIDPKISEPYITAYRNAYENPESIPPAQ